MRVDGGRRRPVRRAAPRGPQGLPTVAASSQRPVARPAGRAVPRRVRPVGVFKRPLETPAQSNARAARGAERRVRRAESAAAGPTLPIQRQPVGPHLTDSQRARLVAVQTKRLAGVSPADRERAARFGDRGSREAIHQAGGAQSAARRQVDLRVGLDAAGAPRGARPASAAARRQLLRLGRTVNAQRAAHASPGRAKTKIAGLPVEQLGHDALAHVKGGQGMAAVRFFGSDAPRFVGRAGKDIVNLPVGAVKGGYEVVAAANESAQKLAKPLDVVLPGKGSNARAKRLAKGATEGFVGHGVRALANKVEGDNAAARKHAALAAKVFSEHPVNSGLELSGLYGGTGRLAGAAGRRGLLGGRVRRLARTARDPIRVSGTNIRLEVSDSKNLFTSIAQKKSRARRAARGEDPNVARPSRVRDVASSVTGGAIRPGERGLIHRAEDQRESQSEARARVGRQEARTDVQGAKRQVRQGDGGRRQRAGKAARRGVAAVRPGGRVRRAVRQAAADSDQRLVKLAAEKRIAPATLRADLEREKARLDRAYQDEHGTLMLMDSSNEAALNNRSTAAAIDDLLGHVHQDPAGAAQRAGHIFEAGRTVAARAQDSTRRIVEAQGMRGGAEQAVAASVRSAAVGRYGARHDSSIVDAPDQAVQYAAAKDAERAARAETRSAKAGRKRAGRQVLVETRRASREQGRARILDEQGRRLQGHRADALEGQAAQLEARAAELKAKARRTLNGPEAVPRGPETRAQRRYRQQRDRLGQVGGRMRGAQQGSAAWRRAQEQHRRAKVMEARARDLRREAGGLPGKRTVAFVQRLGQEVTATRNRVAGLEARIARASDPQEGARLIAEHDAARARLRDLERAQVATGQRLARSAGETAPRALGRLEKARAGQQVAERRLASAESRAKAAKKAQVAARRDRQAAKPVKVEVGLVGPDGRKMTTGDVIGRLADEKLLGDRTRSSVEAWRASGGKRGSPEYVTMIQHALEDRQLPAFLSNKPQAKGRAAYRVNAQTRRTVDARRRTGESTRLGADSTDMDAVEAAVVRSRLEAEAITTFDDFAHRWGQQGQDGRAFTPEGARAEIAARHAADVAAGREPVDWRALSVAPQRYGVKGIEDVIERQDMPNSTWGGARSLLDKRVEAALNEAQAATGPRNVALVRGEALDRWADHQSKTTSPLAQTGQKLTSVFRGTVLPFSPKWLTGNVVEAMLRSTLNGVTPVDVRRGMLVMKKLGELDKQAAREFDMRATGGLIFGTSERLSVHRDRSALTGTGLEGPAVALGAVARVPVIRHMLAGLDHYQQAVFGINRWAERKFQQGVIGKEVRRELRELSDSWYGAVRLQRDAFEDVTRGLLGTDKQVRFAEAVDEVLGKYSRFSPTTRRVTQIAMPFLPWYLNSYRFILHTLPVKHPVKTAVLANVETTYDKMWAEQRKSIPPGALESAIPTGDGGLRDLARFTPFGAATDLPSGFIDPVFPQLSTAVNLISSGQDFTGRPAELSGGDKLSGHDWRSVGLALYSMFEASVPGISIARRLREGGETPYANSTVLFPKTKRGTARAKPGLLPAAKRIFDPFRPVYLKNAGTPRGADSSSRPAPVPAAGGDALSTYQGQAVRPSAADKAAQDALNTYYDVVGK